jgi:hypothetical protein
MAVNPKLDSVKLSIANGLNAVHTARNSFESACERKSMLSVKVLSAAPLLCFLAACGAASGTSNNSNASAPVTTNGEIVAAVTTNPNLGVNVNTIDIWQNSRPFMNLIYGTPWSMQNTAPYGNSEEVPASDLDANGWIKQVPAGYRVLRGLSVAAAGGNIVCKYQGNGTLTVVNGPATNVVSTAGQLTFTLAASNPADWKGVTLAWNVDSTNYIRNLDCREASASTTASIAPEFLNALKGFGLVRFMKWQPATEGNWAVTWATRNKPGDGDFTKNDGVPVEYIVDAANQANADAFVTVPWNADNDYITRFATYVRDNLASGHKVYVELSNEVWNGAYPVYAQACNEAKSEGLLSAEGTGTLGCAGERYAEKTQQVMAIWSSVFTGQSSRLVRVFAFQHVQPYWSDKLLAYKNTYQSVDALATAPYFGHDAPTWTAGQSLDSIMNTLLPAKVTEAINFGVQQKTVAQKYGLQYLTYEAGQHVVLPSNLTLLTQIERDSRMSNIYNQFISGWQSQVGSELTLFALNGPISQYGAWGMSEYIGQPATAAPKMSAVNSFLGISTSTSTTTTTQVCPDGSVIPLTSTCPTPTTSTGGSTTGGTTGGTTTTSPGQRKGIIKKSATV